MDKESLFERIGGAAAIAAVVEIFYQKQLLDPNVKGFFKKTDLEKLKSHQRNFFAKCFGGPDNYTGKDMVESHKDLFITDLHFDCVKQNLLDTLEELKLSKDMIKEVEVIVETKRADIVFSS